MLVYYYDDFRPMEFNSTNFHVYPQRHDKCFDTF